MTVRDAELRAVVRRDVVDVWGEGDVDVLDEIVAPDIVIHEPSAQDDVEGRDSYRELVETYRTAFPDYDTTVETVTTDEDTAMVRYTARGTNDGEFMGMAPTGRSVVATGMEQFRVADGVIAEKWSLFDTLGLLQQLDVVPGIEELVRRAADS
ncbi:ester cyclase [Halorientalis brevis]|uniref:Ester cyclase n=1 Tax=Halorientalis brevis TaxID=1126241 RepID=A0ABD6C7W3_9EURY|nr:ester cyclase [Halorientalis brevis]